MSAADRAYGRALLVEALKHDGVAASIGRNIRDWNEGGPFLDHAANIIGELRWCARQLHKETTNENSPAG